MELPPRAWSRSRRLRRPMTTPTQFISISSAPKEAPPDGESIATLLERDDAEAVGVMVDAGAAIDGDRGEKKSFLAARELDLFFGFHSDTADLRPCTGRSSLANSVGGRY